MITVIIPYYQNKPGILSKAIASISAQKPISMPIHVLIIDDASPVSAESELNNISHTDCNVQIVRQTNGGPGAARNTGLDLAPAETRYIAFLDSDDEWSDDHLSRAVAALGTGYEFYFTDHYQLNSSVGAFARAGRIQPNEHPLLATIYPDLHAYQGSLLDQIIRGNVIGTSTVVYDFLRFSKNRFKVEFTNAGEDYLFWMEIAHSGAKVAFSNQCEARYGTGVNIYAGTGWGSEKNLLRIHNEIKYKKLTCTLFPVTESQRTHIKNNLNLLRTSFAQDLLHRIMHKKKLPFDLLKKHLQLDPLSFFHLPKVLVNSIYKKK
ncbi:glycosyltransferase family 2 protein [Rhodoferax sp.]|uniref:glycosyltransferase family 2 protein n=1 Tax=Rhodoferax sp. TaxID=50421 RepID=UPI0025F9E3E1|nr:glycosyltransferase family 2 protein [Rhodoferax sp.]